MALRSLEQFKSAVFVPPVHTGLEEILPRAVPVQWWERKSTVFMYKNAVPQKLIWGFSSPDYTSHVSVFQSLEFFYFNRLPLCYYSSTVTQLHTEDFFLTKKIQAAESL